MESVVQQLTEWLESQVNQTVHIRKEEQGDLDEIELKLEKVVVAVRNETHPDDYEAKHSIILNGEGFIRGKDEEEPLPNKLYEIPFNDKLEFESESGGIHIHTDRAEYTVAVR